MGKFESLRAKYINNFDRLSDMGKMEFLWIGAAILEDGIPNGAACKLRHPEVVDLDGLKNLIVQLDAGKKIG